MAMNRSGAVVLGLVAVALLVGGLWGRLLAPGEGRLHGILGGGGPVDLPPVKETSSPATKVDHARRTSPTIHPLLWTSTPTPSSTSTGTPLPTITLTAAPLSPTATELPFRITGALAIDGPRGKVYAPVRMQGRDDVGVFSARDGSYLGSLGIAGAVAVDAEGGRVLVDDPTRGLHVLDAESGELRSLVPIVTGTPAPTATPQSGWPTPASPPPLYFPPAVDPATGTVIVVRRDGLWRVERGGSQARPVDFASPLPWSGSDIDRYWVGFRAVSFLGRGRRIAVISACSASFGTLPSLVWLSYDRANDLPVCDGGGDGLGDVGRPTVMKDGRLVVSASVYRMPTEWRLYEGGEQRAELFEAPASDPLWLPGRDLLVAQVETPAGDLLILDQGDLTPLRALPAKFQGRLAGYDRVSDTLFFTTDSSIQPIPFGEAEKAPSPPASASGLRRGARGDELLAPPALASLEGLHSSQPQLMPLVCRASPQFRDDQTALCSSYGRGVFRTEDGGRSYRTAMHHLPSWTGFDLQLSPNFPNDRTAYLALDPVDGVAGLGRKKDTLYRSHDGGDTWIPSGELTAVAPVPDPRQSRSVYAFGYGPYAKSKHTEPTRAYGSTDAGATWKALGELPDANTAIRRLYAIPQPGSDLPVLIAIGGSIRGAGYTYTWYANAKAYRSTDGGWTWSVVLSKDGAVLDESLLVVRSAVAGTALIMDRWEETAVDGLVATATPAIPGQLPLPSTLRSYDLGATWHYVRMDSLKRPLATDDDGNLIGADPDKPAVAIYTLATATPRPSATSSR